MYAKHAEQPGTYVRQHVKQVNTKNALARKHANQHLKTLIWYFFSF